MESATHPRATLRQCAFLADGLGSRLGEIVREIPKPVLEEGGRPFIAWLMHGMLRFGVDEFLILTGHLFAAVQEAVLHVADALPKLVSVKFTEGPLRAGTGSALFHAAPLLDERFLLCNGDSFFGCNIPALMHDFAHNGPDVLGRLIVRDLPDAARYGIVTLHGDHLTSFKERPDAAQSTGPGTINAGIYALDKRILAHISEICSLERDVLPKLLQSGQLRATNLHGWFVDIGVPDDLACARRELAAYMDRAAPSWTAMACRTTNKATSAASTAGSGCTTREAVAFATSHGWHVFLVINQAGVASELYGENRSWHADGPDKNQKPYLPPRPRLRAPFKTFDTKLVGISTNMQGL